MIKNPMLVSSKLEKGVLNLHSKGEVICVITGIYTEFMVKHRTDTNPGLGQSWKTHFVAILHKWSELQIEVQLNKTDLESGTDKVRRIWCSFRNANG